MASRDGINLVRESTQSSVTLSIINSLPHLSMKKIIWACCDCFLYELLQLGTLCKYYYYYFFFGRKSEFNFISLKQKLRGLIHHQAFFFWFSSTPLPPPERSVFNHVQSVKAFTCYINTLLFKKCPICVIQISFILRICKLMFEDAR